MYKQAEGVMFKRAMRVMMVGLVAMLGFKAEAHYVVVNGKVKYCSVCVYAQLEKGNPVDLITTEEVDLITHTEKVQFCLKTKEVEILCSNGTVVQSTENVTLVVQKLIDDQIDLGVTIEVRGVFSDEALLNALLAKTNFCPGLSLPSDVLIRAAKVEIKTYACNLDPTLECEQVKFVELDCMLPKKFNFENYPKNLPTPDETLYVCS
jgi:hypothetical protein